MPKQYEAIRDEFMSKGMAKDMAQEHAARVYNSKHPGRPLTPHVKKHMALRAALKGEEQ